MTKLAPEKIFRQTQNYFPLSCVDLIIITNKKFLLTKRSIEPDKDMWHIPGGIIHKGESILDVVHRVAREEIGIKVKIEKYIGTYEDIRKKRHTIVHCFLTSPLSDKIHINDAASDFEFFFKIPKKIPSYQIQEIKDAIEYIKNNESTPKHS